MECCLDQVNIMDFKQECHVLAQAFDGYYGHPSRATQQVAEEKGNKQEEASPLPAQRPSIEISRSVSFIL